MLFNLYKHELSVFFIYFQWQQTIYNTLETLEI